MHELGRTNFAHPVTDIFLGGILAFGFRGQVVLESKTISRLYILLTTNKGTTERTIVERLQYSIINV